MTELAINSPPTVRKQFFAGRPESVSTAGIRRLADHLKERRDTFRKLADHIDLRRQSVYRWEAVPLEFLRKTIEYSGLDAVDLRPDLLWLIDETIEAMGVEVTRDRQNVLIEMLARERELDPHRRKSKGRNARKTKKKKVVRKGNGAAKEAASPDV